MSATELDSVKRDEADPKRLACSREAIVVPMDNGQSIKAVEYHLFDEGGALEYGFLLGSVRAVILTTPTVNNGTVGPHQFTKVFRCGEADAEETVLNEFELCVNSAIAAVVVRVRCRADVA